MKSFIKLFLCATTLIIHPCARADFHITDYELGATRVINDFFPEQTIDLESFVSGPGLEKTFNFMASRNGIPGISLTTPTIIHQVISALKKDFTDRTKIEHTCVETLQFSIKKLAKALIPYFIQHPAIRHRLVIFGGVALGTGPLYTMLLQKELNRLRKETTVDVFASPLNDERAIIGAVAYVVENNASLLKKPYAIGIDLGGTHIRAGKVNLGSLQLTDKIVTTGTFSSKENLQSMSYLSNHIKQATTSYDLSHLPSPLTLGLHPKNNFLHKFLKDDVLEQLYKTITSFDLDDVAYICIASPGINDEHEGVVRLAFNVPLTNVCLTDELHQKGIPPHISILLTSDVGSAGIGELVMGAGQEASSIFVLGIGTGLNLCYVKNEELDLPTPTPAIDTDPFRATPLPPVPPCWLPASSEPLTSPQEGDFPMVSQVAPI